MLHSFTCYIAHTLIFVCIAFLMTLMDGRKMFSWSLLCKLWTSYSEILDVGQCWAMLGKKQSQSVTVSVARIETLWPARTCASPTPPAHSGQLPRKLPGRRTVPWLAKSKQYSQYSISVYQTYIDLLCFCVNYMTYNISQLINIVDLNRVPSKIAA